jgi:hypothetical protein
MKKYAFLALLLIADGGLCDSLQQQLALAAEGITQDNVRYDPKYYSTLWGTCQLMWVFVPML